MHGPQPGEGVGDQPGRAVEHIGPATHLRHAQQEVDRILVHRQGAQAVLQADEVPAPELCEQQRTPLLRHL